MENGGGGEHRPWAIFPEEATFITDVYRLITFVLNRCEFVDPRYFRTFVDIHYSMVPYLLTTGTNALANGIRWSLLVGFCALSLSP
jgi:hypothetical protein